MALCRLISVMPGGLSRLPKPYPLSSSRAPAERWFKLRHNIDTLQSQVDADTRSFLAECFTSSEQHARLALQSICNAYFLDDLRHEYSEAFVEIKSSEFKPLMNLLDHCHTLVHRYGELVGGLFGCQMEYSDGLWYDTCRVSLLHLRFGQSSGFTARYVCTICGEEAGDCIHLRGHTYPKIAGNSGEDGNCDICGDTCHIHDVGTTYQVPADFRLSDIRLQEVSLVPRST